LVNIGDVHSLGHTPLSGDSPPKLVCILGVGRTGTNHLASILSSIPEIESRREVFNPTHDNRMQPNELEEWSRLSGVAFPPPRKRHKAAKLIRRRPELALDCLARLMQPEKKILTFKVFMGHLSARQVRTAIIGRPDTAIVFIRRRPIDIYISRRKAETLKKWGGVDTTEMKIAIDAGEFLSWRRRAEAWYRSLEAACWSSGKPFQLLSYEEDIDIAPAQVARRFRSILERFGVDGLTIPDDEQFAGYERQDRNSDVRERIANWPDFHSRLAAMGAIDKAFSPIPNFEPRWWDRLCRRLRG
jgi:hypothetical protein